MSEELRTLKINQDGLRFLKECRRIRSEIRFANGKGVPILIEESRSYAAELVTELVRCNPDLD